MQSDPTYPLDPADVGAIVLFSGGGGSTLGLKMAGVTNTIGVEFEKPIADVARRNGHRTVCTDVRKLRPTAVRAQLDPHKHLLVQSSPPCPGFSRAGLQKGLSDLPALIGAMKQLKDLNDGPVNAIRAERLRVQLEAVQHDARSALSFDTIRWIADLQPEWVMLEQVPAVLPLWEAYAEVLEAWGYSVRAGYVNSEQFGVPQTRKRAELAASRVSLVEPLKPTHSRYYPRTPDKLDLGVQPWVSMAQALTKGIGDGYGLTARPSFTVTGGGTDTGGAEPFGTQARESMKAAQVGGGGSRVMRSNYGTGGDPRNRGERSQDEPAPTVTTKIGRNKWTSV